MGEEEFKFSGILEILKRRWRIISIITLLMTISAVVINFFVMIPEYQVNTKIFIGKEANATEQNYSNGDVELYKNLLKTYCTLMTTNKLVENAIKEDNLNVEAEEIISGLTVVPRQDTQILEVSYWSSDKYEAKEVIESVIKEFMIESKELIPNGISKIIEDIKLPQYPSSPNKKMNISIAFLLGIMIGCAIVILLECLDDTFKTKEKLEMDIELPVIGVILHERKIKLNL